MLEKGLILPFNNMWSAVCTTSSVFHWELGCLSRPGFHMNGCVLPGQTISACLFIKSPGVLDSH